MLIPIVQYNIVVAFGLLVSLTRGSSILINYSCIQKYYCNTYHIEIGQVSTLILTIVYRNVFWYRLRNKYTRSH